MRGGAEPLAQSGANHRSDFEQRGGVRLWVVGLSLLAASLTLMGRGLRAAVDAGTYDASLVEVVGKRGLTVDPGSLIWLKEPTGLLGLSQVFFLASRGSEPPDLYFGYARTAAGSAVLDVVFLSNLTRSSSAAEGSLQWVGSHLSFAVQLGEMYDAIVLLDVRGESPALTADWPTLSRVQNAITNLQETGRMRGFGVRRYPFVPPPESVQLRTLDGRLFVRADGEDIVFDPERDLPLQGAQRVQHRPASKGRPGTITWLVDTVRRVPFVGPEPIEWLEHTVFGATDRVSRLYHAVVPSDSATEAMEALAARELSPEKRALLDSTGTALGLPPNAIEPVLPDPLPGEGAWLPLSDDPFIRQNDNAPPAFYQTFVRVDPEREFTRVYITLWDPRQVDLHIAMGTREPESATGETGEGQIPRDPALLERIVAAFNGGFQAMHGEFGMMADGRVYLPPKPYAATVAVHDDGRVALGSWPGPSDEGWNESTANAQIPDTVTALRQNLTSVVEDGAYNPWQRWWWGAAPTWAAEQTYIHRSGLCLTEEGYLAYLWGEAMGPDELGRAMLATRCIRGMHLDMNSKHTSMEFLRTLTPQENPEAVGRPLKDWEFEGALRGMPGYRVRARKAVKTMTPLRFPRYLGTDPRDFFYLSLRPVLPGPPLQIGRNAIPFRSQGMPMADFPPAFARAQVAAADGEGTWLLRIDPSRAVPVVSASDNTGGAQPPEMAVAFLPWNADTDAGAVALYEQRTRIGPRFGIGAVPADGQVLLRGRLLQDAPDATAAIGIDAEGFLVYAQASQADARHLAQRLSRARVQQALAVPPGAYLQLESPSGLVGVGGQTLPKAARRRQSTTGLAFVADARPRAQVLFPDVKPRPYRYWGKLQDQRVRYFPEGTPRFRVPEAELSP